MSVADKIKGCYIAFDHDLDRDEVFKIKELILMIKGVEDMQFEEYVINQNDWMNRKNVKNEIKGKILNIYNNL